MNRLTLCEKEKILELTKKGYSLNKISNITKIRKTTIYYHVRKTFGIKYKKVRIKHDKEKIGESLGVFSADGHTYKTKGQFRTRIYFSKDEKQYCEDIVNELEILFSKKT